MKRFSYWQRFLSLMMAFVFFCATTLPVGCGSEKEKANVADTQTPTEQYANAEQMEFWIAQMDPFVSQNTDWTYTMDWEGFLKSTKVTHHEVWDYFQGSGSSTEDTDVIELLQECIELANVHMQELRELFSDLPAGSSPWMTYNSYWWGKMDCFGGGDEDWMLSIMRDTTAAVTYLSWLFGIPGKIVKYYLKAMVSTAEWCNQYRGYFCIVYTYVGIMYVTCG